MKLGNMIKILRQNAGHTQEDLANILNVGKSTISQYETGSRTPDISIQSKIADTYNVSLDYLNGRPKTTEGEEKYVIPVYSEVACGVPYISDNQIVDYEEIDPKLRSQGNYFGVRLKGDSMLPKFSEGDVVIVRQQDYIESGKIGIVRVNGDEATMKIVKISDKGITLIATNPNVYPPHFYTKEEVIELPIEIIGKVIELRAKVD